jgi:hypothetical protein
MCTLEELVLICEILVINSAGLTARAPGALSGPGPPLSDTASSEWQCYHRGIQLAFLAPSLRA